jgi:transposase-like protein
MKCPRCGSDHISKHGIKITVSQGRKQRYQCQECGHTFYYKGG